MTNETQRRLAVLAILGGEDVAVTAQRLGVAAQTAKNWLRAYEADELAEMTRLDELLAAAPYLDSDELAEEVERPLGTLDFEHARICAEARGLSLTGDYSRWSIRPVEAKQAVELVEQTQAEGLVEPVELEPIDAVELVEPVEPIDAVELEPIEQTAEEVEPVEPAELINAELVEPVGELVEPVEPELVEQTQAEEVEPVEPMAAEPINAELVEPEPEPELVEPEPIDAPEELVELEPVDAVELVATDAPEEPVEEPGPTDEQRLAMERAERRAKRQERELGLVELPRPQKLEPLRPQKLEPRTERLCAVPDTFWG